MAKEEKGRTDLSLGVAGDRQATKVSSRSVRFIQLMLWLSQEFTVGVLTENGMLSSVGKFKDPLR